MLPAQIIVDRFIRREESANLNIYEKMILVILASYTGKKGNCYPSYLSLSKDCSMSVDSVKRYTKTLERKGLIKIIRSSGVQNSYELTIPSAHSTQCYQQPGAISTPHPVLTALPPSAHSTPNNISNNIKDTCEVETSPRSVFEQKSPDDDVRTVFVYWQEKCGHPKALLDPKRKNAIKRAISAYGIDTVKQAIDGCAKTPFNMGDNEKNQRYDDIELILRNASNIERFIKNAENPPVPIVRSKHNSQSNNIMDGVCYE